MQGELSLCDAPPACIYSTRNYLSHLDIPCWYFCMRPSYLPSARLCGGMFEAVAAVCFDTIKLVKNPCEGWEIY
jgi:hypothetical protein